MTITELVKILNNVHKLEGDLDVVAISRKGHTSAPIKEVNVNTRTQVPNVKLIYKDA